MIHFCQCNPCRDSVGRRSKRTERAWYVQEDGEDSGFREKISCIMCGSGLVLYNMCGIIRCCTHAFSEHGTDAKLFVPLLRYLIFSLGHAKTVRRGSQDAGFGKEREEEERHDTMGSSGGKNTGRYST